MSGEDLGAVDIDRGVDESSIATSIASARLLFGLMKSGRGRIYNVMKPKSIATPAARAALFVEDP